jgi:hypothetical protein
MHGDLRASQVARGHIVKLKDSLVAAGKALRGGANLPVADGNFCASGANGRYCTLLEPLPTSALRLRSAGTDVPLTVPAMLIGSRALCFFDLHNTRYGAAYATNRSRVRMLIQSFAFSSKRVGGWRSWRC